MTLSLFAIFSAVVFIAAFIQGALGIGFALIVAPVIGMLHPEFLPVTLLILMLPLNGLVARRELPAAALIGPPFAPNRPGSLGIVLAIAGRF